MDKESNTKIYGVLGYPAKHSLSPLMHNAAFRALKINAEYKIFEIAPDKLEHFLSLDSLTKENICGLNITIPYKIRVLELASLVESITVRTHRNIVLSGAINTIKRENGKLHYYNTDTAGFMESLQTDLKFDTRDKNILIFGCGGAGRAVITGLTAEGTGVKKVYIYDINIKTINAAKEHFLKFDFLKDKLEFIISAEEMPNKIKYTDLLVNASPVGMSKGDGSVIDKNLLALNKGLSVYDVVYNRETQLIKDAKELGLRWADGLGMLLCQGVRSFEIWTDKTAPIEIMREKLREALCT